MLEAEQLSAGEWGGASRPSGTSRGGSGRGPRGARVRLGGKALGVPHCRVVVRERGGELPADGVWRRGRDGGSDGGVGDEGDDQPVFLLMTYMGSTSMSPVAPATPPWPCLEVRALPARSLPGRRRPSAPSLLRSPPSPPRRSLLVAHSAPPVCRRSAVATTTADSSARGVVAVGGCLGLCVPVRAATWTASTVP